MKRQIAWVSLIALGMALGSVLSSYEGTRATAVAAAQNSDVEELSDELVGQIQDLKAEMKDVADQVKAINSLLQSGRLKVVVVINPDS